ncbi:Protein CBG13677 [Caenorhabditis briggsae]|uniref:Protein CBG13677 n=1 Tax=Caenorhabditis briggsae TaxID=6238 RepID=A8XIG7_CAEBR|nr:Protein CBG13677 [Caenorhabditis briggsae]CAP32441.2 Protein CBG13677 [Caenorhabditis briggsae]
MKTQLIQIIISIYLLNASNASPKTSAETGNDIENFLLNGNSVKELSPKPPSDDKKGDKFMEDLIQVQRTYRDLKEKWQRMMKEKTHVIQMASSTTTATPPPSSPTTTTSITTSSEIQEIDVDVFEAPDKFQDISGGAEFDDEAFVDISATSSPPKISELDEIQTAIKDALGPSTTTTVTSPATVSPPATVTPSTTVNSIQMDQTPMTIRMDQTTPKNQQVQRNQQAPELTMLNVPRHHNPSASVATPWRHHMVPEDLAHDPFEASQHTTSSEAPTPSEPSTTTKIPQHILPTSSFHSSGANPDAQPATNLFRHPDPVKIPFFESRGIQMNQKTTSAPMRPTTPESFRSSEEIQNLEDVRDSEADVKNSDGVRDSEVNLKDSDDVKSPELQEKLEEVEASDDGLTLSEDLAESSDDVEEEVDSEDVPEDVEEDVEVSTPRGIENSEDYVEETFSKEINSTSSEVSGVPESVETGEAPPEAPELTAIENFGDLDSPPGSAHRPKAFGSVPSFQGPQGLPTGLSGSFGSPPGPQAPPTFGNAPSGSSLEGLGSTVSFGSPPQAPLTPDRAASGSFGPGPRPSGPFGLPPGPHIPPTFNHAPSEPSNEATGLSGSFGSPRGPQAPPPVDHASSGPSMEGTGHFGSPPGPQAPPTFGQASSGSFGSGPGPQAPLPTPQAPPTVHHAPLRPAFGIGRAPPGFSEPIGPTLPPSARPQKPGTPYPTLVDQVENFFNEGEEIEDTGASSALGSFGSAENGQIDGQKMPLDVPVSQNIQVMDDPKVPNHRTALQNSQVGIFGTKLRTINERAYKPPMFPASLSSEVVKMHQLGNPYVQRTTVPPIGPHGLRMEVNSVDEELPAWNGVEKNRGIMNKARREYQKEFEQQVRDVRMIDEEINKISKINDEGRSKNTAQRCSQAYAHTLSLPQVQKMSMSLGLGDVANVIQKASDLVEHQENDIAQLELDLEEKRKLIAKIEILLSLAESRALLFDLLNEQKKIAEKMENHALDLLQKNNFRQHTPSPFSAASDISELSSAVQQVLNLQKASAASKKGWSMMKRKLHKKSKLPLKIEVIDPSDVVIRNSFIEFNKKAGHLQETAEVVEPVLSVPFVSQNDQFGRQPVAVAVHRRTIPMAPPTMSPTILVRRPRPSQLAAMHLPVKKPLSVASKNQETDTVHELIDMLHEDIVKLPAEEEEKVCKRVQCDFEKADLCNYESSHDETTRRFWKTQHHQKRQKRASQFPDDLLAEPSNIADDLLPYTFRAWSIWAGRRAEKQKQIDIGPTYSSRNLHFAAVFLEPQQAGILSIPLILSPTSTKIRFRLFEGTRGIRLRICCDRYCPLETEQGLYRGHRNWLRKTVTCPANTQTLSFECLNDGPDRGACGIDDIFVDSRRCHKFFNGSDQN